MLDKYFKLRTTKIENFNPYVYNGRYCLVCKYCGSTESPSICEVKVEGENHIPICLNCIRRFKKSREVQFEKYAKTYFRKSGLYWRKEGYFFNVYSRDKEGDEYLRKTFNTLEATISFIKNCGLF